MPNTTLEKTEEEAKLLSSEFLSRTEEDKKGFTEETEDVATKLGKKLTRETDLIYDLHVKADNRLGIKRYIKEKAANIIGLDEAAEKEDVVVRDARAQKPDQQFKRKDQAVETYMLSMAATARSALSIIEESNLKNISELKAEVMEEVRASMIELRNSQSDGAPLSKKQISASIQKVKELENIILDKLLEHGEIDYNPSGRDDSNLKLKIKNRKQLLKLLDSQRDLLNLKDKQPAIATLTHVGETAPPIFQYAARVTPLSKKHKDEITKLVKFVENYGTYKKPGLFKRLTGVGLTEAQKNAKELPNWAKDMKPEEQLQLVKNAADILEGRKTIATSLRFIPGARNTFYQVALKAGKDKTKAEIFSRNLRTATPVYFKAKNEKARIEMTNMNLDHLVNINGDKKLDLQIYNPKFNRFLAFVGGSKISEERTISTTLEKAVKQRTDENVKLTIIGVQEYSDKTKMMEEITTPAVNGSTRVRSCKSGKDRTGMATSADEMNAYLETYNRVEELKYDEKVALAISYSMGGHDEIIAGSYGGNHGSLGKKTNPIYRTYEFFNSLKSFMKGKFAYLADKKVLNIQKNKAASLNRMKADPSKKTKAHTKAQLRTIFSNYTSSRSKETDAGQRVMKKGNFYELTPEIRDKLRAAAKHTSHKPARTQSDTTKRTQAVKSRTS